MICNIADADLREARSCLESLPHAKSIAKSNKKITSNVCDLLKEQPCAEGMLQQYVVTLITDLATTEARERALIITKAASLQDVGQQASLELEDQRASWC